MNTLEKTVWYFETKIASINEQLLSLKAELDDASKTLHQENDDKLTTLSMWTLYRTAQGLSKMFGDEEFRLRAITANRFFASPKEGMNKINPMDGFVLEYNRKINRTLDPSTLDQTTPKLRSMGVNVEELIRYIPELALRPYRNLTKEQIEVLNDSMIEKDAAPELKLINKSS